METNEIITYLNSIAHKKDILDGLLQKYKAQPVGFGYIDIITKTTDIFNFIEELSKNGFLIIGVTRWFHCLTLDECPIIGMGGPKSIYYTGRFAEIGYGENFYNTEIVKELKYSKTVDVTIKNNYFLNIIKEKQILSVPYRLTLTLNDLALTPSLRLLVPNDWRNIFKY